MLSFVVVCHSCFSITMHAKLVLNTNTMLVIIKFYTHQSWKLSIRKEKKVIKLNWNFYFIFNKCDISIGMGQNIFNKFFHFFKSLIKFHANRARSHKLHHLKGGTKRHGINWDAFNGVNQVARSCYSQATKSFSSFLLFKWGAYDY
jgi:hypothetical protein